MPRGYAPRNDERALVLAPPREDGRRQEQRPRFLAHRHFADLDLAAEIAENAPLALRSTRATLRAGLAEAIKAATDHEFSEQQWLMKTDDFREGVASVNERRPGKFTGK